VNNSANQTSPRPPLRGSATTVDRRGARAKEHVARPPARFSSRLSTEPPNKKPKQAPCASRTARQKSTKFISGLDQPLFAASNVPASWIVIRVIHRSFICSFIKSEKTLDSIGLSFVSFIFPPDTPPSSRWSKIATSQRPNAGPLAPCCFLRSAKGIWDQGHGAAKSVTPQNNS